MDEEWGGPIQVAHGETYRPTDLPCVIAEIDGSAVGYAALRVIGDVAWIGVIGTLRAPAGSRARHWSVGLAEDARSRGCRVLRAITTNDNRAAQSFYAALGFRLIEIRSGEVDESRRLKPRSRSRTSAARRSRTSSSTSSPSDRSRIRRAKPGNRPGTAYASAP